MGLANYQAAGKTGTSNVASGNGTPFAAFAGYTTNLVAYVSVFNPISPVKYTMTGYSACYDNEPGWGGLECPGEMFGANAPASTWHMTFDNANLSGSQDFAQVSPYSTLWSQGDGQVVKQPPKKGGKGNGGGGNGGGGNGGGGTAVAVMAGEAMEAGTAAEATAEAGTAAATRPQPRDNNCGVSRGCLGTRHSCYSSARPDGRYRVSCYLVSSTIVAPGALVWTDLMPFRADSLLS